MKAVLHHDLGPGIRALVESAESEALRIAIVPAGDAAALARALAEADILLHVLAPVTAEMLAQAPRLKLVQKIGVGVDAIDLEAARGRGIAVCNMPGTNTQAVVELVLALLLACLRRIVPVDAETRSGRGWPLRADLLDGIGEIGGRTVGLIGYGAVGRRLRPVLEALGARVIASDPYAQDAGLDLLPLDDLLAAADVVSLHAPLTSETNGLLDAHRIGLMKRGAIVINTARGPLIEERALAEALRSGKIAAAGLDVFPTEPPAPDTPLFALPNVVVTPHLAWLTEGTWRRSLEVVAENGRRLAVGAPLLHRVA
jgi:phosphoglycerate dehydrogenase-like enzyme